MKKTLSALILTLCLALCSCRSGAGTDPGTFFAPGNRYPLNVSVENGKLDAAAILEIGENGSARLEFAEGFEKRFENDSETDVLDDAAFTLEKHSAFFELIAAVRTIASGEASFFLSENGDGTLKYVRESDGEGGRITLICGKGITGPIKLETESLTVTFVPPGEN